MDLLLIGATFDLCSKGAPIMQFVGYILLGFKIVIPLLLLVLGSFELGKAIVAQKDDEIKGATSKLVKKLIVGVVIFFIPTIISLVFGLVADFNKDEVTDEYKICQDCISRPTSIDCTKHIDIK